MRSHIIITQPSEAEGKALAPAASKDSDVLLFSIPLGMYHAGVFRTTGFCVG